MAGLNCSPASPLALPAVAAGFAGWSSATTGPETRSGPWLRLAFDVGETGVAAWSLCDR
jgi:hypothetical protein